MNFLKVGAVLAIIFFSFNLEVHADDSKNRSITVYDIKISDVDYTETAPTEIPEDPEYTMDLFEKDIIQAYGSSGKSAFDGFITDAFEGTGEKDPIIIAPSDKIAGEEKEAGLAGYPFTTSRADLLPDATNDQYPYRAAGAAPASESLSRRNPRETGAELI